MNRLGPVGIGIVCLAVGPAAADDFSTWKYSRPIQFDTSPTGAGVKDDVRNFPVAVTLAAGSFDFTQAKEDGSDLRFSEGPDGKPLPHAVEHWDRANRTALVWVKVPTVRGNSTGQSIVMHWGNPVAANAGDPKAVFDTKDGFVGVWHLDEDGNTAEGGTRTSRPTPPTGPGSTSSPGPGWTPGPARVCS